MDIEKIQGATNARLGKPELPPMPERQVIDRSHEVGFRWPFLGDGDARGCWRTGLWHLRMALGCFIAAGRLAVGIRAPDRSSHARHTAHAHANTHAVPDPDEHANCDRHIHAVSDIDEHGDAHPVPDSDEHGDSDHDTDKQPYISANAYINAYLDGDDHAHPHVDEYGDKHAYPYASCAFYDICRDRADCNFEPVGCDADGGCDCLTGCELCNYRAEEIPAG